MITVSCDICKKKIDNPINNRNVFHLAYHSICESCKDNLEQLIKPILRDKEPYAIGWYDKLIDDSIQKAIQRGKI